MAQTIVRNDRDSSIQIEVTDLELGQYGGVCTGCGAGIAGAGLTDGIRQARIHVSACTR
jgi:hypothetical protein